jgi:beta-lactamase class A
MRGTARAYGASRYENRAFFFDLTVSTRIPESGSKYWFGRVSRVGSVRDQQRNLHGIQPVADRPALTNTFGSPTAYWYLARSMKDLLSLTALLIGGVQLLLGLTAPAADEQKVVQPAGIAEIERDLQGHLGVAILDTANNKRIEYHATDRFPMCSTFKCLMAADVLERVDQGKEQLDRKIAYGPADLLEWAPVTQQHVQEGSMTVDALCAAAIEYSDNTAANLLLQAVGGPQGLTEFFRSLGDSVTRLDRNEPTLNTAIKGDEHDTTTPAAMLDDLKSVLLDEKLSVAGRQRLEGWLVKNTTGDKRLRAGLPSTWRIGDKTGTGENAARGDLAIARPPNRAPILIVVYSIESPAPDDKINAAFGAIGKLVGEEF